MSNVVKVTPIIATVNFCLSCLFFMFITSKKSSGKKQKNSKIFTVLANQQCHNVKEKFNVTIVSFSRPRPATQLSMWHSVIPAAASASRTDDTMAADRRRSPSICVTTATVARYTVAEMMDVTAL